MDKRIFGLRNQYSVVLSAGGQRQLSPEEVGRRLFGPVVSGGLGSSVLLRNGGRLHLDVVSRPEYVTPQCGSVLDLVVHDKAGERILEGLVADAGQWLRKGGIVGDISVFKSNAGPAGSSYGCQEDYLAGRRGEFGRLADILIPFLVTRQLICGAGTVVQTPRGAMYCLSRPAGHIGNGLSSAATRSRPLINTRDEPRAAAAGLRRLRVIVSDSTMSETTTLLKAGAIDLVLRMAEAATVMPGLTLGNPVQAIGEVSRDITGRSRVRLADGRQMSALDIQREYLAKAKNFTDRRGADAASRRVLGMWGAGAGRDRDSELRHHRPSRPSLSRHPPGPRPVLPTAAQRRGRQDRARYRHLRSENRPAGPRPLPAGGLIQLLPDRHGPWAALSSTRWNTALLRVMTPHPHWPQTSASH